MDEKTKLYIEKIKEIHGNIYDLSKIKHIRNQEEKLPIICKIHGEFNISMNKIINRNCGCPKCGIETRSRNKRLNKAKVIIDEFKKVHGNKYDYSKVEYTGNKDKVTIICPIHGEFLQSPDLHKQGYGCAKCGFESKSNILKISNGESKPAINKLRSSDKEFILKSINAHGNKYDYSKVDYINNSEKIIITCPIHGDFLQSPNKHKNGAGCSKCKNTTISMKLRSSSKEFIEKSLKVHGDKYSYDKVVYTKNSEKIIITCPIHGDFLQVPYGHLSGKGCPKCGDEITSSKLKLTNEEFIEKSIDAHGNKYNYEKTKYLLTNKKVIIACPIHGEFLQLPHDHLKGKGCSKCGDESASNKLKLTTKEFIEKSLKAHDSKYSYDKVDYKNNQEKVIITCPIHGDFLQIPNDHMTGYGCIKCGKESISQKLRSNNEEFIEKSSKVHNGKYSYNKVNYRKNQENVIITCPIHGDFQQSPKHHLEGMGCRKCSLGSSSLEEKVRLIIESLGVKYEQNKWYSTEGKKWEVDIFLPDYNLGIECHGNYWHSEVKMGVDKARKIHFDKFNNAAKEGITLLQFFEDEINNKAYIIKKMIAHRIGIRETIYARKCSINVLEKKDLDAESIKEIKNFFDENHIQGSCNFRQASILSYENEIVGVMLFNNVVSARGIPFNPKETELVRLAFSEHIQGGASRLLVNFLEKHTEINKVVSYSDNCISTGNVYKELGFELDSEVKPDYKYIKAFGEPIRFHKSRFKRINQENMSKSSDYKFDKELTEVENANNNLYFRVWNAGLLKWILKF